MWAKPKAPALCISRPVAAPKITNWANAKILVISCRQIKARTFCRVPGRWPELHALEDVEVIFEKLRERDRLYRMQRYKHSYPHCWRCGTELIFYSVKEWFIRADAGAKSGARAFA